MAKLNFIIKNFCGNVKKLYLTFFNNLIKMTPVSIEQKNLSEILEWSLSIPEYQRGYCWKIKNVKELFETIKEAKNDNVAYLGVIVLQEKQENGEKHYEIIDGQQRLTTLTIWAEKGSLLDQELVGDSQKKGAIDALKRAKKTCKESGIEFRDFGEKLVFSVIILNKGAPENLAFSFFSDINSKGVTLSDYDLLKAHHLRFLKCNADAQESIVKKWNTKSNLTSMILHKTLFRLRKWTNKDEFSWYADDTKNENHEVFNEFKSVFNDDTIGISAKEFSFNDFFSGGEEFFAYFEFFAWKYKTFEIIAKENLCNAYSDANNCVKDTMFIVSFLYFLKFGAQNLNDAILAIAHWIGKVRSNESQIRCATMWKHTEIQNCISAILRSRNPKMFFQICLNIEKYKLSSSCGFEKNFNSWKNTHNEKCYYLNSRVDEENSMQELILK